MPRILAAALPDYLPSMHVFRKMKFADEFLLADDVQFSGQSPLQRARIAGPEGRHWLTVPVLQKHRGRQPVAGVQIDRTRHWQQKHWRTLQRCYQFAPYFDYFADEIGEIYRRDWTNLLDVNLFAIEMLRRCLRIQTPLRRTSEVSIAQHLSGSERIVVLAKECNCDTYLASPGDESFLDERVFHQAGVLLQYLSPAAEATKPELSAVDGLFKKGMSAMPELLK